MELTDAMIMQILTEADAAERKAKQDAMAIGCNQHEVRAIQVDARCETICSYLYQAGILQQVEAK